MRKVGVTIVEDEIDAWVLGFDVPSASLSLDRSKNGHGVGANFANLSNPLVALGARSF